MPINVNIQGCEKVGQRRNLFETNCLIMMILCDCHLCFQRTGQLFMTSVISVLRPPYTELLLG